MTPKLIFLTTSKVELKRFKNIDKNSKLTDTKLILQNPVTVYTRFFQITDPSQIRPNFFAFIELFRIRQILECYLDTF